MKNVIDITGDLRMIENEGGFSAPDVTVNGENFDRLLLRAWGSLPDSDRGGSLPIGVEGSGIWDGGRVRIRVDVIQNDS